MKTAAALFGVILSTFLLSQGCGSANHETNTSSTCNKSAEDYTSGYKAGHDQAVLVSSGSGGTSDYNVYIANMNNGYGPIGTISDCWKEGFDNGYKEAK